MNNKLEVDEFSDDEIARRRDELAKHMLNMPPQPLKPKSRRPMAVLKTKKTRQTKSGRT